LLSRCKDPGLLFEKDPPAPPRLKELLADPEAAESAEAELKEARRLGVTLLPITDPAYPELLRELPDPPLVLRVWGCLTGEDKRAVSVVGTRAASAYGRRQAARFAGAFAKTGLTVVSGLARGIDAVAHAEALRAGGRTVAVLGSGLSKLYPPEHRKLARAIASRGAVVSEFPLTTPPHPRHFPRRNRIIAGLSLGVVVIEAGKRSGALITAAFAAEQGRLVFAVPGQVDAPGSEGVHALLRDGATLVCEPGQVLEDLAVILPRDGLRPLVESCERDKGPLSAEEARLLGALPLGPVAPQEAAHASGMPLGHVLALLTSLELKGYLRRYGDSLERVM